MRRIIAGMFISLDGVVESPDQWHFPYFNEEMGAPVDATLGELPRLLLVAPARLRQRSIRRRIRRRRSCGCATHGPV